MNKILLVGKPNSGKSLLFNRLTGLNQKVANYPGVTVSVKEGQFKGNTIVDLPGAYSLNPISDDEKVTTDQLNKTLNNDSIKLIVCVLDLTRLNASLRVALQVQNKAIEFNKPIIFALNMFDALADKGDLNIEKLQNILGSTIIPLSAKTEFGLEPLKAEILKAQTVPAKSFASDPKEINKISAEISKTALSASYLLKKQNKLDSFFLAPLFGGLAFFFIMLVLFQSIFTWSSPLMDMTEAAIGGLGAIASSFLSDGWFKDFVVDALFGGLGSFLVFVPQIFVLTFIIGILEDSGYMARAAVICHRLFSFFGLNGQSFVPLLSAHACAIPAIYAARTISSPKRRWITMMSLPLIPCSARLPVYSLFVVALIPETTYLGGLVGLQGMSFFGLYAIGWIATLLISVLFSKTLSKNKPDTPFVVELPPYRLPHWQPLFLRSYNYAKKFVTDAGPLIFGVTVLVWVLGYFPNGDLNTSFLSKLGTLIEPIFAPMGLDWRYGVAILTSFLAREVFVSTLGTLFGIEGADENIVGLAENITANGLSFGAGLSLLVFFAIALQCVSTVAALKNEINSKKAAWGLYIFYGVLAYVLALITYWLF